MGQTTNCVWKLALLSPPTSRFHLHHKHRYFHDSVFSSITGKENDEPTVGEGMGLTRNWNELFLDTSNPVPALKVQHFLIPLPRHRHKNLVKNDLERNTFQQQTYGFSFSIETRPTIIIISPCMKYTNILQKCYLITLWRQCIQWDTKLLKILCRCRRWRSHQLRNAGAHISG